MTIASRLIEQVEQNNGKFLARTSVWNYWGVRQSASFGESKNSNIYHAVEKIFSGKKDVTKIWMGVGARGRSQHSATEILLFDVSNMSDTNIDNAEINYTGDGKYFNR